MGKLNETNPVKAVVFAGMKNVKVITGKTREEVQKLTENDIPIRPFRSVEEAEKVMPVFVKQYQKWRILSELFDIDRMYGSRQVREISIAVAIKNDLPVNSKAIERLKQAEDEAEVLREKLNKLNEGE